MSKRKPPTRVTVTNKLTLVSDQRRAADLFATILRSVRQATARREREKKSAA
jgi:hypothetical protein